MVEWKQQEAWGVQAGFQWIISGEWQKGRLRDRQLPWLQQTRLTKIGHDKPAPSVSVWTKSKEENILHLI